MFAAALPRSFAMSAVRRVGPVVSPFRAGPAMFFSSSARASAIVDGVETAVASNAANLAEKSKVHGSYHWNYERALSVVTIPLLASALIVGPVPLVDFGLGVVLPLHTHLGFDCIVQDYVPVRKFGVLNTICTWTLRAATGLVLYGCFLFNTNDVGITAFVKRLWTGKL